MIKSNSGFSLIEVLVATVLLALIAMGVATSMNNYFRDFSRTKTTTARDRYLNSIVSMLEVRIAQMEVSFDQTATISKDYTTFPYYWSADFEVVTLEECKQKFNANSATCPLQGRMNYLIRPIPGVPNMFETFIYFYHPELNAGQVREFTYFLSVK